MHRFRTATLWYTIVGLIGPVVALVLTPLYTRAIGVAGYGTVDVMQSFWQGIYTIAFWGMGTVFAGIYLGASDEPERQIRLTSVLVAVCGCALVVSGLLLLTGVRVATVLARPETAVAMPLLALALPFAVVNATLQAVFRVRHDVWRSVVSTLGLVVITAATRLGLVVWGEYGVNGMLAALALTNILMALLCVLLGYRYIGGRADRAMMWMVVRAGAPLLPASITGWMVLYADRWLLAPQVSAVALGQYALAVLIASLLAFAYEPVKNAWQPIAVRCADDAFLLLSGRMVAVLVPVTVTALLVLTPLLLALVAGSEAAAAAPLVLPLLAVPVAGLVQMLLTVRAVKAVRTGVLGVSGVLAAAVNIGLNLLLIPTYGVMGAAWATAAAAFVATMVVANQERPLVRVWLRTPEALLCAGWVVAVVAWWWTGALWLVIVVVAGVLWRGWQVWPQWRSLLEGQRDDTVVTGEIGQDTDVPGGERLAQE